MKPMTSAQKDTVVERDLLKVIILINRAMFLTQDKKETAILHYHLHQARQEVMEAVDPDLCEVHKIIN